jgi:hypothetical protein
MANQMSELTRQLLLATLLGGQQRSTTSRQRTSNSNLLDTVIRVYREFHDTAIQQMNSEHPGHFTDYCDTIQSFNRLFETLHRGNTEQTQQPTIVREQPIVNEFTFERIVPTVTTQIMLTPEQIQEHISTITYHSGLSESRCPISMEDFSENESISQINSCHHIFKTTGLMNWLRRNNTCPVCRQPICPTSPNVSEIQSILTSLFTLGIMEPNPGDIRD